MVRLSLGHVKLIRCPAPACMFVIQCGFHTPTRYSATCHTLKVPRYLALSYVTYRYFTSGATRRHDV